MQTVITTIASVPFAMAICALLKRQWPQVTGWITPVVILACTSAAGVLGQYADSIPPIVWIIAGPIVAAVGAIGLHQAGKDAVATATPALPVRVPSIAQIEALACVAPLDGRPLVRRTGSGPLVKCPTCRCMIVPGSECKCCAEPADLPDTDCPTPPTIIRDTTPDPKD